MPSLPLMQVLEKFVNSLRTTVEPLYCVHYGTTVKCPDYRGVHILEASGIFPVGVAMHTRAVECYEGVF